MSSILELILFYATKSQSCILCSEFIDKYSLPVIKVRLDTEESRVKVLSGKYFNLEHLPTLVTVRNDGTLSVYVGAEKIIERLKLLVSPPSQPQRDIPQNKRFIIEDDIREEKHKSKRKKKKKKKTQDDFIIIGEDDINYNDSTSMKLPSQGLAVGPQASISGRNGMSDLIKEAKRMEQMRLDTLGYKEEEYQINNF